MSAHKDKFRTAPSTKAYRNNHAAIFGPAKGSKGLDADHQEALRRDHHAKEAEDGKKDAQWYLDNERRVASNPDHVSRKPNSPSYKDGHSRIFGDPT